MSISFRNWFAIGASFFGLSVACGAFGAHALRDKLSAHSMEIFEKSVFYHSTESLGLLLLALAASTGLLPERAAKRSCFLIALGILLFSGSLYLLALTEIKLLGLITPFGGLSFLIAWFSVAFSLFRTPQR